MNSSNPSAPAYDAALLLQFAQQLLQRAGMPADRAHDVADILVEGDLLGHDTHGLQLLPTYLAEIESGSLAVNGDPEVLSDLGAVLAWDGKRLPGPWLTLRAIEEASRRARRFGAGIVNIRRSHHIAALAPYARRVAEDGLVLLLMTSAPAAGTVAPFGGTRGVFSPSPIGVGIPTGQEPMLVDVSTSITTNGLTGRLAREGRKLPAPWLIDERGVPTDDPAVLVPPRAGTILPLGGVDAGHKGYGLSLMVEALTAGLAGQGRSDPGQRWGGTVFVQVIDPAAFNGLQPFQQQMDWIAGACRANPPVQGGAGVRLPGERGLALRRQGRQQGVPLAPGIVDAVAAWAGKLGVPMPAALA
ncbi:Ldh family oxidoreductase [Ramlibacter sp.]|uniref:Ldh family oxidoreductase n=1 Tax=Ramlibacter sp. TaxID=1917967 RepID=UPI002D0CF8D5|nr:Ldh family oxidoreductase [Ramlibacter sp.]HWI83319.1 Ldh family oxidoreductase [Ramlibacter sp.]